MLNKLDKLFIEMADNSAFLEYAQLRVEFRDSVVKHLERRWTMNIVEAYEAVIADIKVDQDNWYGPVLKQVLSALETRVYELKTVWTDKTGE